ncbi:hypothetical protein Sste5346_002224 [Sporothrix stenoceras]|uniref:Cytochrome c oxidase, subunit VIb n=1 Tax=Sporothrix stenoceras TaxID=5173 RepID=A0ABR3ZIH6_9PEZI
MGFLSSLWNKNPTDEERRAEAVRTGEAVPSRAERQKCWDARDNYFGCLDRINVIDAVEPRGAAVAQKACAKEGEQLEKDCAAEWVAHFKKFRVANHQKEQRLAALKAQGANEVQINNGPGDSVPVNRN